MSYQSYENLAVWEKAVDLSVRIYELFRECRDYGFKDQICRAAVSVPSNDESLIQAFISKSLEAIVTKSGK